MGRFTLGRTVVGVTTRLLVWHARLPWAVTAPLGLSLRFRGDVSGVWSAPVSEVTGGERLWHRIERRTFTASTIPSGSLRNGCGFRVCLWVVGGWG